MSAVAARLSVFKPYLPIILIVAVSALIILILALNRAEPTMHAEPAKVWRVETMRLEEALRQPYVDLYGRIEAPSQVSFSAQVAGQVDEVLVREGHRVSAGQALVNLDRSDLVLVLAQREAELSDTQARMGSETLGFASLKRSLTQEQALLSIAQRNVSRQQSLHKKKLSSRKTLDEAERAYALQALSVERMQQELNDHPNRLAQLEAQRLKIEASIAAVELDLQRAQVVAPFDAQIIALNVQRGSRVGLGAPLLSLFDYHELEVRSQIPSRYLSVVLAELEAPQSMSQASPSQPLMAQLNNDGEIINLRLDRISPAVQRNRGGVDALFKVAAQDVASLLLGRTVSLRLALPALQSFAVPARAIFADRRIFKLVAGKLRAVEIEKLGPFESGGSEWQLIRAKSGDLLPNDEVLITKLPNALSGMAVEVKNKPGPANATINAVAP